MQQAWWNDSDKMTQHNSMTPSDILHYFATPPKITHVRFFFSILDALYSPGLRWRAKHGHCMECPHGKPSPNVLQGLCNENTQRTKVWLYIMLGYQDVSYFVHKKSAKLNELNKMEGTKKHVVVTVCFLTKSPASKFRSSVRGWRRCRQHFLVRTFYMKQYNAYFRLVTDTSPSNILFKPILFRFSGAVQDVDSVCDGFVPCEKLCSDSGCWHKQEVGAGLSQLSSSPKPTSLWKNRVVPVLLSTREDLTKNLDLLEENFSQWCKLLSYQKNINKTLQWNNPGIWSASTSPWQQHQFMQIGFLAAQRPPIQHLLLRFRAWPVIVEAFLGEGDVECAEEKRGGPIFPPCRARMEHGEKIHKSEPSSGPPQRRTDGWPSGPWGKPIAMPLY